MGYRNYIALIDRELLGKIRELTNEELLSKFGKVEADGTRYFSISDLDIEVLHCLGDVSVSDGKVIVSGSENLFLNEGTREAYAEYEPYVIGKQGLMNLIEVYRGKVIRYFENLLEDDSEIRFNSLTAEEKTFRYVEDMLRIWTCEVNDPLLLNENWEEITDSHLYEYYVFELVRKLKTIDFEKYDIIYYGH